MHTCIFLANTRVFIIQCYSKLNQIHSTHVHTLQLLTCLQWKRTPLHWAPDAATVQLLLEHGANIHAVNDVRSVCIMYVCT